MELSAGHESPGGVYMVEEYCVSLCMKVSAKSYMLL